MPHEIERVEDPARFASEVEPFLARREAENNLLLGIASGMAAQPDGFDESNSYLAIGRRGGQIVGAAIWTTGYRVVLSFPEDVAFAAALGAAIVCTGLEVAGFLGPTGAGAPFAGPFLASGVAVREGTPQLIYRLGRIPVVPDVPGSLRAATREDRETLIEWWMGFVLDTSGEGVAREVVAARVDGHLASAESGIYVWQDGEPVSMATARGRTPNGIRIGGVYTPPSHRNRGYASASVASLSRRQLESGRTFCFLFTDAANPTSNSIYRRMGYEQVAEVGELVFNDAPRR